MFIRFSKVFNISSLSCLNIIDAMDGQEEEGEEEGEEEVRRFSGIGLFLMMYPTPHGYCGLYSDRAKKRARRRCVVLF